MSSDPRAPHSARLLVRQARWIAEEVVELRLTRRDGLPLPPWEPGAHVELTLPSGLRRAYSLCGDPQDLAVWTIAVHRAPDSRGGSRELHETALVGRELTVDGPVNRFPLLPAPGYLLLAGGIGVTPLLPMARALAAAGLPWRLVLGARDRSRLIYAGELAVLGGDRVRLVPQDEAGLPDLAAELAAAPPGHAVYACGPAAMLNAVAELCRTAVPPRPLHVERFSPAADAPQNTEQGRFEVLLRRTGLRLAVPADRSVLEVVRDRVPDVSYSCEEGYCGSCETSVLAGTPDHRDSVLGPEERATATTMMICVSRAASPLLELDL
ncbi:PDR/VanB family oxidoreductase [Streptomyces cylindrosporus]|uniref:PDR/VanB family oxidoreductase n=1 Tax=Streptomyces cylindrosporus TaxID=2927583 RepID=A0ABS9YIA5_9ACTN|nr:PDR/VanB family oxidoreductase [Streptomyces cylindrosporus]MCI3276909.1 PDR/VanB family oxidoreductase [Streptomyces cylindrosporus]